MIAGAYFSAVFTAIGGQQFVISTIEAIPIGRWGILIMMQIIYLLLGCFMDPNAILMLSVPIFVPIIKSLGFDSLWFGVIFIVNMEMSFLTPPFGMNLFYMKGIAPKNISIGDIYRSIMPFVLLQMIGLIICMVFPQTILWLPNLIMGN